MKASLYVGTIRHRRYIPKAHFFVYPFFMYYVKLDELEKPFSLGRWFSTSRFALSRFDRRDYYGEEGEGLQTAIARRMEELTGVPVQGPVYGLLNMRTLGLYFSPVNFYYAFDREGRLSHFLAEVSNTPWNERHQYACYLGDGIRSFSHEKRFKVSPFNPVEQHYRWHLSEPGSQLEVGIEVHDPRGRVFEAKLQLKEKKFSLTTVRSQLLRIPVMTVYTLAAIYWQALKIYCKKIPYIPYRRQTT